MAKSINRNIPEPRHPENLKALLSALLEVGLVYGLLLLAWRWFSNTPLADWEKNIFHLPIPSTMFALVVTPMVLIHLTGRSTCDFGLSFNHRKRPAKYTRGMSDHGVTRRVVKTRP